jgi:hypothetical protein
VPNDDDKRKADAKAGGAGAPDDVPQPQVISAGDEPAAPVHLAKTVNLGGGAKEPDVKPFNIEEAQEKTRGAIAAGLVGLLFMLVIFAFMSLWSKADPKDLKTLLDMLLAPIIALVGSATGFYFGGKK